MPQSPMVQNNEGNSQFVVNVSSQRPQGIDRVDNAIGKIDNK